MLYAPLRALIYIDSGDRTRFAVDQPSTVLAGFADPAIAELGADLDHQLAELLKPSASERPRFSIAAGSYGGPERLRRFRRDPCRRPPRRTHRGLPVLEEPAHLARPPAHGESIRGRVPRPGRGCPRGLTWSCFRHARGHDDQVLCGRHLPGAEVIPRLVRYERPFNMRNGP